MNMACSCYEALSFMLLMENLAREQSISIDTLRGWNIRVESSRVQGWISLWRLNNEHQACKCQQHLGQAVPVTVFYIKMLPLTPEL